MKAITDVLKNYPIVLLEEMDNVKLMNRTDTKYFFHVNQLPEILRELKSAYSVLEIESNRCMKYQSTYFDTLDFNMYNQHQNGKGNRYKIRKREYVDSNLSFLEVKFKSNKGRTHKTRVINESEMQKLNPLENSFVSESSPYNITELDPVIRNSFERITLVNRYEKERVTIDLNLRFKDFNNSKLLLPGLCIIEVKKDLEVQKSKVQQVLKSLHINENNFSKYLIGTMLLNPDLKYNRSKKKILMLNKINIKPVIVKNHEYITSN